jgi:hypothetical protein
MEDIAACRLAARCVKVLSLADSIPLLHEAGYWKQGRETMQRIPWPILSNGFMEQMRDDACLPVACLTNDICHVIAQYDSQSASCRKRKLYAAMQEAERSSDGKTERKRAARSSSPLLLPRSPPLHIIACFASTGANMQQWKNGETGRRMHITGICE